MKAISLVLLVLTGAAASAATPAVASAKPAAAAAIPVKVLQPRDAQAYAAAFAAIRQGDFAEADRATARIKDRCLMGRLTYERLMHPAYAAGYGELTGWLKTYHDQPDADRVWTLAKKKQLAADAPPPAPDGDAAAQGDAAFAWDRTERVALHLEAPVRPHAAVSRSIQAARDAFYGGEVDRAYKLAKKSGERWVLGLAAYRMNHFDEARSAFAALSTDSTQNEWVRSAGAFWAARAAIAGGHAEQAPAYLRTAATTPYTFYGLIAERQLGLEPAVGPEGFDTPDASSPDSPTIAVRQQPESALRKLVRSDKRARRAVAFSELGLKAEAGLELRTALLGAGTDAERRHWVSLAVQLGAPLSSPTDQSRGRRRFDLSAFQTPELFPIGGYTLDKALVYALVKQESKFNADASSTSGAVGLMQLTPSTAARITQDDGIMRDPAALKDPALNLRIGQDYVSRLLDATKGDLLHAIAAYNSGPGVIARTAAQMPGADSLLVFESMPGGQTREYVQKVVANYWIYRLMLGKPSHTLDAAAGAAKAIQAVLDQTGN